MLTVIATPIGNLEDMTYRAVRTLREVSLILCEDTRVTRTLLTRYKIVTPMRTLHQHTRPERLAQIVEDLKSGTAMALVTDAGTPGVSDPGNQLVAATVAAGVPVMPLPGASALTAIVSVAGIDMQRFVFLAYPPHKKGRQTFFARIAHYVEQEQLPVIYYDSVHRVVKNLHLLMEKVPMAHIIVGRELTKIHEEVVRGSIGEVLAHFTAYPDTVRGEFVIIVYE